MAIPKVCGIETEYGIMVRGADSNPVTASSLLINAYLAVNYRKVGWDFEDEHPGNDARGFASTICWPPTSRPTWSTRCLTNGARYYVDHAHPEISTPECLTALEVVRFDRAAEEIIRASMAAAIGHLARRRRDPVPQEQLRRQGQQLRLPRELPAGPVGAVRADRLPGHPALRHPPDRHRRRQGRLRAPGHVGRRRAVSRSASGPTSSRRRSAWRRR